MYLVHYLRYYPNGLKVNQGTNYYEINIEKIKVKGLCILNLFKDGEYLITVNVLIE